MRTSIVRFVSCLLVVCLIGMPFQVNAGLIGTDQVVTAAQVQAARATVLSQLSRAELTDQLQAFGLTSQNAKDRVAALTDTEVTKLAGQIDSLPAGASGVLALIAIILIGILIWSWGEKK